MCKLTLRNSFSILFKEEVVLKMIFVSWFDICLGGNSSFSCVDGAIN